MEEVVQLVRRTKSGGRGSLKCGPAPLMLALVRGGVSCGVTRIYLQLVTSLALRVALAVVTRTPLSGHVALS